MELLLFRLFSLSFRFFRTTRNVISMTWLTFHLLLFLFSFSLSLSLLLSLSILLLSFLRFFMLLPKKAASFLALHLLLMKIRPDLMGFLSFFLSFLSFLSFLINLRSIEMKISCSMPKVIGKKILWPI